MRRQHILPLVALAGICALALATSGAAAKEHHSTQRFATHISIKLLPDQGLIKGKVTSEKGACVNHREVFLNFRGDETPLNPPEFASRTGRYIIHSDAPPLPEGAYRTHVKKVQLGSGKICKPAQSEIVDNPA